MNVPSTILLPNALLLLVHLHILEYPRSNRAEYDCDMFNTHKRGLRERSTIMEDITYFLIGKLEGRGVKSVHILFGWGLATVANTAALQILATYPCHQPGESLAFRTSLAKYIEGLRHQCIFAKGDAAEPAAWWWRDVVVRKSLLEECAGEKYCILYRVAHDFNNFSRFERLILALTTHTLMRLSHALDPALMSVCRLVCVAAQRRNVDSHAGPASRAATGLFCVVDAIPLSPPCVGQIGVSSRSQTIRFQGASRGFACYLIPLRTDNWYSGPPCRTN